MILDQLISDAELEALPDDEAERFAAMIRLTYPKLQEAISKASVRSSKLAEDIRFNYATEMREWAAELGLDEIASTPLSSVQAEDFIRNLTVFASRQRIIRDMKARSDLVQVSDALRLEILKRTAEIRREIEVSGLTERRKKTLLAKLDAFERELAKPKSNAAMLIGAVVLVTAGLSDAGGAVKTVQDSTAWIVRQVSEAQVSESRAVAELPNLLQPARIVDGSAD